VYRLLTRAGLRRAFLRVDCGVAHPARVLRDPPAEKPSGMRTVRSMLLGDA
jgi:hypothetical protein